MGIKYLRIAHRLSVLVQSEWEERPRGEDASDQGVVQAEEEDRENAEVDPSRHGVVAPERGRGRDAGTDVRRC